MKEKHGFTRGFICGGLTAFVVVMAVVFGNRLLNSGGFFSGSSPESLTSQEAVNKLETIYDIIEEEYLDEIDEAALVDGLYSGVLSGLGDPYSVYYTVEEYESLMEQTQGSYSGIGAVLTTNPDTGLSTVVQVYEGAPSAEAGMLADDIITEVDGEDVTDMDLSSVVALLKGETGTEVVVTVVRGNDYEEVELTMTRAEVEIPTVTSEMLEDNIGYVYVAEFDSVTTTQFIEAIEELEEQGMERLIVDLRSNPGGNVQTVCEMLEYMLDEGLIVYTEDKNEKRSEYNSEQPASFNKPLAVLVNGNSASASEIFAGAIQDYDKGVLVGTQTFGKGIVQKIIGLSDGSALKLTYSKYFTPSGRDIHETGIAPDIEVELEEPENDEEEFVDNQLEAAIEAVKER